MSKFNDLTLILLLTIVDIVVMAILLHYSGSELVHKTKQGYWLLQLLLFGYNISKIGFWKLGEVSINEDQDK